MDAKGQAMMRAVVWAVLMLGALLAHGCGGISTGGEDSHQEATEPAWWEPARVRTEWPSLADAPACLTVWVIEGDRCGVSADGIAVEACASGPDPYVMLAVPDDGSECRIGLRDCEEGRCEK